MSKRTLLTIVVIIIVVVGIWYWNTRTAPKEEPEVSTEGLLPLPEVSEGDTTTQIQQDLDQIDIGDINEQFQGIDADLNNL